MDYKYIEQLIESYWDGKTTVQEEEILRAFFAQSTVPAELERYRSLFEYEAEQSRTERLGTDFDERLCQLAGVETEDKEPAVRARRVSFISRLRPLTHAAAAVAVVALVATGAQYAFNQQDKTPVWDYNAEGYHDTYDTPQEAYETLDEGLRGLQEALITDSSDSLKADSVAREVVTKANVK